MHVKSFVQGVLASVSISMFLVNKHMNNRIDQYRMMYEENLMFLEEHNQNELNKLKINKN